MGVRLPLGVRVGREGEGERERGREGERERGREGGSGREREGGREGEREEMVTDTFEKGGSVPCEAARRVWG